MKPKHNELRPVWLVYNTKDHFIERIFDRPMEAREYAEKIEPKPDSPLYRVVKTQVEITIKI